MAPLPIPAATRRFALANIGITTTETAATMMPGMLPYGKNTGRLPEHPSLPGGSIMNVAVSDRFHWARLLAFVTGLVNQELLLRNEYLAAENRILRAHLPSRLRLSNAERSTLAEIAKRLGRKALKDIARVAKPNTILDWYRRLVAQKFDGSRRVYPGRPRISPEVEALVVRFARENRGWGYDRIMGALANLGHQVSDRTVGKILGRHNIAPAPERSRTTTWKEFIRAHMDILAGADFFTVEVLTWRGLVTYYVLFFIQVGSRRVSLGGITRHPDSCWMEQVARNATMQDSGYLNGCRYLLHDRDKKFCREFRQTLAAGGVQCTPLPVRSPNLNAHAERWVRSIKEECLSKLILFGERSLHRVVSNFLEHYHQERNHQGKDNLLLFPASVPETGSRGAICRRERLGGLLNFYSRAA
jgi:putative transposase